MRPRPGLATIASSSAIAAILVAGVSALTLAAHPRQDKPKFDLNGLWRTGQGALVNIKHTGTSVVARYVGPRDCATGGGCPLGKSPEYFVRGTFDGVRMSLTMMRCTHQQDMRDEGISEHWTTPTKVQSVTPTSIHGTFRSEWYKYDTKDGKRFNFQRDASGDSDAPFALTRTNCKEELDRLRAEIERLKGTWRDQEGATRDVEGLLDEAIDRWGEEAVDTFRDQVIDNLVPPKLRVGPGAYIRTPEQMLTDWIDAFADIAKDAGKWVSMKWIGFIDFLIDWTNLMAKGVVTINEVEDISNALDKMRAADFDGFLKWLSALATYQALLEHCRDEVPAGSAPSTSLGPSDPAKALANYESADRGRGTAIAKALSSAKGAESAMVRAGDAFQPILGLLQRHGTNTTAQTIGQALSPTESTEFRKLVTAALTAWLDALRALRQAVVDYRAIPKFVRPAIG